MEFVKGRRFTEADFADVVSGKIPLPNYEPAPQSISGLARAIAGLAAGSGLTVSGVAWALVPGARHKTWARYFFNHTQGGSFDGTGTVLLYRADASSDPNPSGGIARFALCAHKPVSEPGANPRRGWHPAHCELCGLDLTVDSGD